MPVITYAQDSTTLTLNGRVIVDFSAGDYITLAPANALTSRVNGSNNSVSIAKRVDSGVHDLTINVIKDSDDDIYFKNAVVQGLPVVFNGSLKENYNKDGESRISNTTLENGTITTQATKTLNNQDGNAVKTYVIQFRNVIEV
jgi:hypothetical protein